MIIDETKNENVIDQAGPRNKGQSDGGKPSKEGQKGWYQEHQKPEEATPILATKPIVAQIAPQIIQAQLVNPQVPAQPNQFIAPVSAKAPVLNSIGQPSPPIPTAPHLQLHQLLEKSKKAKSLPKFPGLVQTANPKAQLLSHSLNRM